MGASAALLGARAALLGGAYAMCMLVGVATR